MNGSSRRVSASTSAASGFYLGRRAESVLDDLKARAVWLESAGRKLVLVGCDVIGFTVEEADSLRAEDRLVPRGCPGRPSSRPRRTRTAGPPPSPCPGWATMERRLP
ncbi:MAG: hypothetical protein MZV64_14365 [Ignavibacteriales bacterium]|nr:hypothetical protein [Ignavibacteriales bacterium]